MKAILLSIKPKYVAKIVNGEKTIEVRKNKALYKATMKLIGEQGYATFFMYCTKDNDRFVWQNKNMRCEEYMNGKVVAKFTLRKVEEILEYIYPNYYGEDICDEDDFYYLVSQPLSERKSNGLKKTTCLSDYDLDEYLEEKDGYAYHIEDLVIFDKPKELSEFHKIGFSEWCAEHPPILSLLQPKKCYEELKQFMIIKAPQNFCYVESEE